jgi:hypothetical protein
MSIFGRISDAIFGSGEAHAAEAEPAGSATAATNAAVKSAVASAQQSPSATPAALGTQPVDVAAVLDNLKKNAGQPLDWRKSIVDLMKLLKLDSSLTARKTLADELKYPGDKNDSAAMNMWLHKQVMAKLAASGGVVPKDLHS